MKKRVIKITGIVLACVCVICVAGFLGINAYVKAFSAKRILKSENASGIEKSDCILVLGCLVKPTGEPSDMLGDRLKMSVELYKNGVAPKIIMSGDHGQADYDEVNTMKQYAKDNGVPSEDIFMDHAGFSTYESLYRAKEIFGVNSVVIVSQEYHLYRAVYIAEKLGIKAYGVGADYQTYVGQSVRDAREVLARVKDFTTTIFKPKPTYLGEKIPVSGNGDITNDK